MPLALRRPTVPPMRLVIIVAAVAALAACSSSGSKPSTPAKASTTYGMDAALLASRITGCTGVTADGDDGGAFPGLTGAAHCTLLGHKVELYTWSDAASENHPLSSLNGPITYYAKGTGWVEIVSDGAAGDAQKSIAQSVAGALGGTAVAGAPGS